MSDSKKRSEVYYWLKDLTKERREKQMLKIQSYLKAHKPGDRKNLIGAIRKLLAHCVVSVPKLTQEELNTYSNRSSLMKKHRKRIFVYSSSSETDDEEKTDVDRSKDGSSSSQTSSNRKINEPTVHRNYHKRRKIMSSSDEDETSSLGDVNDIISVNKSDVAVTALTGTGVSVFSSKENETSCVKMESNTVEGCKIDKLVIEPDTINTVSASNSNFIDESRKNSLTKDNNFCKDILTFVNSCKNNSSSSNESSNTFKNEPETLQRNQIKILHSIESTSNNNCKTKNRSISSSGDGKFNFDSQKPVKSKIIALSQLKTSEDHHNLKSCNVKPVNENSDTDVTLRDTDETLQRNQIKRLHSIESTPNNNCKTKNRSISSSGDGKFNFDSQKPVKSKIIALRQLKTSEDHHNLKSCNVTPINENSDTDVTLHDTDETLQRNQIKRLHSIESTPNNNCKTKNRSISSSGDGKFNFDSQKPVKSKIIALRQLKTSEDHHNLKSCNVKPVNENSDTDVTLHDTDETLQRNQIKRLHSIESTPNNNCKTKNRSISSKGDGKFNFDSQKPVKSGIIALRQLKTSEDHHNLKSCNVKPVNENSDTDVTLHDTDETLRRNQIKRLHSIESTPNNNCKTKNCSISSSGDGKFNFDSQKPVKSKIIALRQLKTSEDHHNLKSCNVKPVNENSDTDVTLHDTDETLQRNQIKRLHSIESTPNNNCKTKNCSISSSGDGKFNFDSQKPVKSKIIALRQLKTSEDHHNLKSCNVKPVNENSDTDVTLHDTDETLQRNQIKRLHSTESTPNNNCKTKNRSISSSGDGKFNFDSQKPVKSGIIALRQLKTSEDHHNLKSCNVKPVNENSDTDVTLHDTDETLQRNQIKRLHSIESTPNNNCKTKNRSISSSGDGKFNFDSQKPVKSGIIALRQLKTSEDHHNLKSCNVTPINENSDTDVNKIKACRNSGNDITRKHNNKSKGSNVTTMNGSFTESNFNECRHSKSFEKHKTEQSNKEVHEQSKFIDTSDLNAINKENECRKDQGMANKHAIPSTSKLPDGTINKSKSNCFNSISSNSSRPVVDKSKIDCKEKRSGVMGLKKKSYDKEKNRQHTLSMKKISPLNERNSSSRSINYVKDDHHNSGKLKSKKFFVEKSKIHERKKDKLFKKSNTNHIINSEKIKQKCKVQKLKCSVTPNEVIDLTDDSEEKLNRLHDNEIDNNDKFDKVDLVTDQARRLSRQRSIELFGYDSDFENETELNNNDNKIFNDINMKNTDEVNNSSVESEVANIFKVPNFKDNVCESVKEQFKAYALSEKQRISLEMSDSDESEYNLRIDESRNDMNDSESELVIDESSDVTESTLNCSVNQSNIVENDSTIKNREKDQLLVNFKSHVNVTGDNQTLKPIVITCEQISTKPVEENNDDVNVNDESLNNLPERLPLETIMNNGRINNEIIDQLFPSVDTNNLDKPSSDVEENISLRITDSSMVTVNSSSDKELSSIGMYVVTINMKDKECQDDRPEKPVEQKENCETTQPVTDTPIKQENCETTQPVTAVPVEQDDGINKLKTEPLEKIDGILEKNVKQEVEDIENNDVIHSESTVVSETEVSGNEKSNDIELRKPLIRVKDPSSLGIPCSNPNELPDNALTITPVPPAEIAVVKTYDIINSTLTEKDLENISLFMNKMTSEAYGPYIAKMAHILHEVILANDEKNKSLIAMLNNVNIRLSEKVQKAKILKQFQTTINQHRINFCSMLEHVLRGIDLKISFVYILYCKLFAIIHHHHNYPADKLFSLKNTVVLLVKQSALHKNLFTDAFEITEVKFNDRTNMIFTKLKFFDTDIIDRDVLETLLKSNEMSDVSLSNVDNTGDNLQIDEEVSLQNKINDNIQNEQHLKETESPLTKNLSSNNNNNNNNNENNNVHNWHLDIRTPVVVYCENLVHVQRSDTENTVTDGSQNYTNNLCQPSELIPIPLDSTNNTQFKMHYLHKKQLQEQSGSNVKENNNLSINHIQTNVSEPFYLNNINSNVNHGSNSNLSCVSNVTISSPAATLNNSTTSRNTELQSNFINGNIPNVNNATNSSDVNHRNPLTNLNNSLPPNNNNMSSINNTQIQPENRFMNQNSVNNNNNNNNNNTGVVSGFGNNSVNNTVLNNSFNQQSKNISPATCNQTVNTNDHGYQKQHQPAAQQIIQVSQPNTIHHVPQNRLPTVQSQQPNYATLKRQLSAPNPTLHSTNNNYTQRFHNPNLNSVNTQYLNTAMNYGSNAIQQNTPGSNITNTTPSNMNNLINEKRKQLEEEKKKYIYCKQKYEEWARLNNKNPVLEEKLNIWKLDLQKRWMLIKNCKVNVNNEQLSPSPVQSASSKQVFQPPQYPYQSVPQQFSQTSVQPSRRSSTENIPQCANNRATAPKPINENILPSAQSLLRSSLENFAQNPGGFISATQNSTPGNSIQPSRNFIPPAHTMRRNSLENIPQSPESCITAMQNSITGNSVEPMLPSRRSSTENVSQATNNSVLNNAQQQLLWNNNNMQKVNDKPELINSMRFSQPLINQNQDIGQYNNTNSAASTPSNPYGLNNFAASNNTTLNSTATTTSLGQQMNNWNTGFTDQQQQQSSSASTSTNFQQQNNWYNNVSHTSSSVGVKNTPPDYYNNQLITSRRSSAPTVSMDSLIPEQPLNYLNPIVETGKQISVSNNVNKDMFLPPNLEPFDEMETSDYTDGIFAVPDINGDMSNLISDEKATSASQNVNVQVRELHTPPLPTSPNQEGVSNFQNSGIADIRITNVISLYGQVPAESFEKDLPGNDKPVT